MDGRFDRGNKAAFSNVYGVMWTLPEPTVLIAAN